MILDNVLITPKKIGPITVQVAIEETFEDELQITEHPVERGAEISDHAFKRNPAVTMQCGWSNSDYEALLGTVEAIFTDGSLPSSEYIQQVYSQLLALQELAVPFEVMTSMRNYESMLIKSLVVKRDLRTGNALNVQATMKHIRIVDTQATRLPPRDDQADPEKTAETENTGVKAAVPGTPAPGGAVAPGSM
ncbi:phage baseplate protein [Herbaspirillum robiniae]|uniref:phage baseplate protein n=1 Tax=Herbaspirillum robiniae TaxID=2014887 RepID=UPI0009A18A2F|nr:hypothetical protein [Herbaspirillum robiniae]